MAGRQSAPSYLKRRRLGWYVQLAVPVALQEAVGAKVLTRSLRTRDQAEARRRSHAAIAELQQRIANAAPANATHPLIATAEQLRRAEAAGLATELDTDAALSAALDEHLAGIAKRRGVDAEGVPELSPKEPAALRRAHDIAAGRPDESLAHLLAAHLAELEGDAVLAPSTLQRKRLQLTDFVDWFGGDRSWREVRRGAAVEYLARLKAKRKRNGSPLSRASLLNWLSDVRVLFRWILDREDADTRPANPFDGLQPAQSVRGREPARRAWTPAELSTILHAVSPNDPLWSLTALAAYSGARREEIASLRLDAIEGESFLVREGKRQASVRRVPIHPVVAPLVSRLVATSKDGFLIPGLLTSGYDKKRGGLVGKRFGQLQRRLGLDDPRLVFHSFRNTVETQMIASGVPLERAQMIVGHTSLGSSAPYIALGSVQDKENRKALQSVSYGADLDRYVRETGSTVTVETKARRRPKRA